MAFRVRRQSAALYLMLLALSAEAAPAVELVPAYTPTQFMQSLYRQGFVPPARDFDTRSAALTQALSRLCASSKVDAVRELTSARTEWRLTTASWEALSAVIVGPLLSRGSAKQIDFAPTRPALIARAIAGQRFDAESMQRIGTPAKGLPALEWLLWSEPPASATPACDYAIAVTGEIRTEAKALSAAFADAAGEPLDEVQAATAMAEAVNQWIGGLERLRWQSIEKPVRSGSRAFPRALSRSSRESWSAQWAALRRLAVADQGYIAAPGSGLITLDLYLRGRGHILLAERFKRCIARVDTAMRHADPANEHSLLRAARELAALKRLMETEVAPALNIHIGFTDADGD